MSHFMKYCSAALATASLYAVATPALADILIDYDDGLVNGIHDASINNGGFEDATNTDWVPTGTNLIVDIRSDLNEPSVGGDNVVMGVDTETIINPQVEGSNYPGQDTGHTIALGDQFSGSYAWRDAFQWDDANDTIEFVLFYTADNTIGGGRTTLFSFTSDLSAANSTWQNEALGLTAGVVDAGAVGKTLFAAFEVTNDPADGVGFVRIDNVFLEVTPVPEPGSLALMGLGGLIILRRRR